MAKPDIEKLKDYVRSSLRVYQDSRNQSDTAYDYFNGYQFNTEDLEALAVDGIPALNYNVIRAIVEHLTGYYSNITSSVSVKARNQTEDIPIARILNLFINFIMEKSNMGTMGGDIVRDGLISGLMCAYTELVDTDEVDQFGVPIYDIKISHVPSGQILLDPGSQSRDYSDAEFITRGRWLPKNFVKNDLFRHVRGIDKIIDDLDTTTDFEFGDRLMSYDRMYRSSHVNSFSTEGEDGVMLIMHTVSKSKDSYWSTYWSGEQIIEQKEITHKEVTFPYRVMKLCNSERREYYGMIKDIMGHQDAIRDNMNSLHRMLHGTRWVVGKQNGGVEDLDKLAQDASTKTGILQVEDINQIREIDNKANIEQVRAAIADLINQCYEMYGINKSFRGQADAEASGRRVKLESQSTVTALEPYTALIRLLIELIAKDVVGLIKQYYRANQVINLSDEATTEKWLTLNQPLRDPETGDIIFQPYLDPDTGEHATDKDNNLIWVPVFTQDSEIYFTDVDIKIKPVNHNNDVEDNQLFNEVVLGGPFGQMLAQLDPVGLAELQKMSVEWSQSKFSAEASRIMERAIARYQQGQNQPAALQQQLGQGPQASTAAIPRTTGEQ